MNTGEIAFALVNSPYEPIKAEALVKLRELQDKLDIETAYNQVHIERIEALKSALNDILDNDGSRRIYSAGGLFDARLEAEALLASIEDVDGFDKTQEHVEESAKNVHELSDALIIEIRQKTKPCDLGPWADTLTFARALLGEERDRREAVLRNFAMSGAFLNELMQMEQPSTGKWWIQ